MRIMCPNCDAEYEVDASAIPDIGRDVQCSNCGHAWFQDHPEIAAEAEAEAALYDPPAPLGNTPSRTDPIEVDDIQLDNDDPETILDLMDLDAPNPQDDASLDLAPKHELDPEALRILREEAQRESAQRAAEQVQPNPDIQAPDTAPTAPIVARRVARLKGIQPQQRDILPDVDSVNATVVAQDRFAEVVAEPAQKTGIDKGFWGVMIVAALALAAYSLSPELARILPGFTQPLAAYVGFIDGLRDGLDALLPQIGAFITGLVNTVKGWL
jgi:predicted Zn finger-like uncharacterized protein